MRPYGYRDDKITVVPEEAEAIRTVVDRLISGGSLRSCADWLTRNGFLTVTGGKWKPSGLKRIIVTPRLAGLREADGELVPAHWYPIITPVQREQLLEAVRDRSRENTPAKDYLLTGELAETVPPLTRRDMERLVRMIGEVDQ